MKVCNRRFYSLAPFDRTRRSPRKGVIRARNEWASQSSGNELVRSIELREGAKNSEAFSQFKEKKGGRRKKRVNPFHLSLSPLIPYFFILFHSSRATRKITSQQPYSTKSRDLPFVSWRISREISRAEKKKRKKYLFSSPAGWEINNKLEKMYYITAADDDVDYIGKASVVNDVKEAKENGKQKKNRKKLFDGSSFFFFFIRSNGLDLRLNRKKLNLFSISVKRRRTSI